MEIFAGDRYVGTASERSSLNALAGAIFYETDTLKVYQRIDDGGLVWAQIDVDKSLGGLTNVVLGADTASAWDLLRYDGSDWTPTALSSLAGDGLSWDSSNFEFDLDASIDLLTDVNVTTPSADQVLAYNDSTSQWENVDLSTIITDDKSFGELTNVAAGVDTATAWDIVRYNGSNWVTAAVSSLAGDGLSWDAVNSQFDVDFNASLDGLTDVTITSVSAGNALFYDGAEWINRDITESDISDLQNYLTDITGEPIGDLNNVSITTASDNDALMYNSGNSAWENRALTESDISDLQNYLLDITGENIGDLNNVSTTGQSSNDVLRYNGTTWVVDDLSDKADTADLADYQLLSEKNQANGYVGLNGNTKIDPTYLPALAITEVFTVVDIDARDALTVGTGEGEVQEGDVAVVTDASDDPDIDSGSASYIYDGSDWSRLRAPDLNAPGADNQVIYNDSGDFGASPNFTFDAGLLSLTGNFRILEDTAPTSTNTGEAIQYTVTGTANGEDYTRLMARVGSQDVIVATYIHP